MTMTVRTGLFTLVLAIGLAACSSSQMYSPSSVTQVPPAPASLVKFTEPASGFSTSDLRDADGQIVQFNTANELIWTADGTRLPGYRVSQDTWGHRDYLIDGRICPQGCNFVVRFGTADGERRAYLTVDYGHENPGTLVDVDVAAGALVVTQTGLYPPGSPTLSGVITEMTPTGEVPVDGATVYRGVQGGWRDATTDRNGFYRIQGLYDASDEVDVIKAGYQTEKRTVSIAGDTRFDVQLRR